MNINRHNYEEYLLDYIEGKLPSNVALAVSSFLEKNPDIKLETEELLSCTLSAESYSLANKESLKKDPLTDIEGITKFEQLSVAFLENDINNKEELYLNALIMHSKSKQYEHEIIQQTRISANAGIVLQNKNRLKHYQLNNSRKKSYFIASLAASIVLLIGLFFYSNEKQAYTAVAINSYHSTPGTIRQSSDNESQNVAYVNLANKTIITEMEAVDSVTLNRAAIEITTIDAKQITQVETNNETRAYISNELFADLATQVANNNSNSTSVEIENYINKTLDELGIDQSMKKKSIIASAGKSVAQFLEKLFKKNIQIEKKEIEDGRKLYAIRAGTFEFYTSVKVAKNKEKPKAGTDNGIRNGE